MNKQEIEKAIEYLKAAQCVGQDFSIAISALTQQLTNGWISVSERLPAINQNVLVTCKNTDIAIDFIGEDGQWFWEDGEEGLVTTAWQPLPPEYKEVSHG